MQKQSITYKDYRKKSDIHGTVLYPAVMVAPMQKNIMLDMMKEVEIYSVFDAFHGSGTSLYECMEISKDIKLVGCDINPLANLITKVKLQGINKDRIYDDILNLKFNLDENEEINFNFYNMEKWFRIDIIKDLKKIRLSIMKTIDERNRLYFWYMLCDIIRKYSNSRSSTYKLHVKEEVKIQNIQNNLINDYFKAITNNVEKFSKRSKNFKLYKCDTLEKLKDFKKNEFDMTITSPPYGDNNTTVPYGQFSMLPLYWIDPNDLELEGWELDSYSKIDAKSMGGTSKKINLEAYEEELIAPFINKISDKKRRKVLKFFSDYFVFLKEIIRVTNKRLVITLGNRTVDRVNIDLTNITIKFLNENGFINISTMKRRIPLKRIPSVTSKINQKSVKSMNYEYVIIHKKND